MCDDACAEGTVDRAEAKKAVLSSSLGSALEWVDFTAYGAASAIIFPKLFFPNLSPTIGLLASFATFGVGFFARPVGGILFGLLGDRLGRKKILLTTFFLMGISSLLIGIMPPYSAIGIWAPLLIVILRFVQGFALGGEATGAQLFTLEHAPPESRGLFGSFVNLAAPASMVIANGMLFYIAAILTEEQFETFGWRLPFIFSIGLIIVGAFLRYNVKETPAFEKLAENRAHDSSTSSAPGDTADARRKYLLTILRLILFWGTPAACFWIVNVYSITFLEARTGLTRDAVFGCLIFANAFAVITTVLGGGASDRFGRKPPLLVTSLIMVPLSAFYFQLIGSGNVIIITLAMALFAGCIQAQSGILPAFFAEQFPTSRRYSGSALAYTGANLIFAGPTPFIAAWITQQSGGSTTSLTIMMVSLVVISLVALLMSPETKGVDLNAPQ